MSVRRLPESLPFATPGRPFAKRLLPLTDPFKRLANAVSAIRRRARERQELRNMSYRDLRDIGLNRGDIERVFDPSYLLKYTPRVKRDSKSCE